MSVVPADSGAVLLAGRGHFTLAEGKVLSVRESGGTIYVNFGRRGSQALTVTILKRHERIFAAAGIAPNRLENRQRSGAWVGRGAQRAAHRGLRPGADRDAPELTEFGSIVDAMSRSQATARTDCGPRAPDAADVQSGMRGCACRRSGCCLAGCSSVLLSVGAAARSLPSLSQPPRQAKRQKCRRRREREHQRILAAYNGAYKDPRLEAVVNQTVDKLVAASERPDMRYRVTILNSPAVNAFALPSGQLYVTRGLIALANDTSELASVLSHEMAHVIAQHAAMREDQARQVALVEPRRSTTC